MLRCAIPLLILSATAALAASPAPPPARAPAAFAGAAPSMDELGRRFLQALATRDRVALGRLRVSEREYLDVIVPGNVEPGAPPPTLTAEKAEYYWGILNEKSLYHEAHLLAAFGGRPLRLKRITTRRGVKRFAGFVAHQQLLLIAEDEKGELVEIPTGSVAEVGGTYKYVSYIRD